MSNTHKIHSQASADGAPSIIHPAGGFQGCQGLRVGWPGSGAGRAGKGNVKAGGLGAFTPVQRGRSPRRAWGLPSPWFIHVRPGWAGSKGSPGRSWKTWSSLLSQGWEAGAASGASVARS